MVYNGYYIPKGGFPSRLFFFVTDLAAIRYYHPSQHLVGPFVPSVVPSLTLCRAMCYDEKTFGDPHAFRPERFLDPKLSDWHSIAFGFGRR